MIEPNLAVKIGNHVIEVSSGHIYLAKHLSPSYDYVPWNIIRNIMLRASLQNSILVDIGANVGDSLAHFRRFSDAPAICVEPSQYFFSILQRNAEILGNAILCNKLLVPPNLKGRVFFESGGQTGASRLVEMGAVWTGDTTSFDELLTEKHANYIIKSDTDGFDDEIISSLLAFTAYSAHSVPIIFFEGPQSSAVKDHKLASWLELFSKLQAGGYNLLFLTNIGLPYVYAGRDFAVARSTLNALATGYVYNHALAHYFDIIAFTNDVANDICTLEYPWSQDLIK